MAKKQKKFHVAITLPDKEWENGGRKKPAAELLIYGIAEELEDEDGLKSYGYDIDEVYYFDPMEAIFRRIPVTFLEAIAGVKRIKELSHFHEPCMMQAAAAFEEEPQESIDHVKTIAA